MNSEGASSGWIVKTERIFPNQTNNVFSLFLFNKATYKHIVEKVSRPYSDSDDKVASSK